MSGWTNAEEANVLEAFFQGGAMSTPSHIGLFSTLPADDGTGGAELTGNGYARQAFAANGTNWNSATPGEPTTLDNAVAVTGFAASGGDWSTAVGWGYWDASTAGNLLFFGALTTNKTVLDGDTASFAIGAIVAKLGDPGDTY